MRKGLRHIPLLTAAALLVALLGACVADECLDNQNTLPLAGFYKTSEPSKDYTVQGLEVYGLGAPGDSVLLDRRSVSEVQLPFRLSESSTTYVFSYDTEEYPAPEFNDTITFRYKAEPFFVSSACGVSYRFQIEAIDYTTHAIESVSCPEGVITNVAKRNINIYFRDTQTQEGGDQ